MRLLILIVSAAAGLTIAAPALAKDMVSPPARPSRMLQAYAKAYDVSVQEAARRFAAQRGAGDIGARLEIAEADTFGGLYIEHSPVHRIVVKFTRDGTKTLKRYTRNPLFVVLPSTVTYKQLVDSQMTIGAKLNALGIDSVSRIDVVTGRLEVYVLEPIAVRRILIDAVPDLPDYLDVKKALDLGPRGERG